jgi:hypothetical protein
MGATEISTLLTWLAVERHVSASTQNHVLSGDEVSSVLKQLMGKIWIIVVIPLGHRNVGTTSIHLHVLNRGALGVRSPVRCEKRSGDVLARVARALFLPRGATTAQPYNAQRLTYAAPRVRSPEITRVARV